MVRTKKQKSNKYDQRLEFRLSKYEKDWIQLRAKQYYDGDMSNFIRDCIFSFKPTQKRNPGV